LAFDHYDPAVLAGVPLALEAGIREGTSGLLVPLVSAVFTAGVRRRAGRPLNLWAFRWQAMAVVTGIGLAAYEGRERGAAAEQAVVGIEAQARDSYVAGQNDVAVGADTVLDLLCRTAPLVASPSAREAPGRALAGWKQALAEQTTAHAAYFGTVVSRWASLHNAASSNLSFDVVVSLRDGDGTAVLTASQATWLADTLDAMQLRGDVRVGLVDPAARTRTHDRRTLIVNEYLVEIPPDAAPALEGFELMPFILASGAMWALEPALSESQIGVPLAVAAPAALGWLCLATVARDRLKREGQEGRPALLVAAAVLALCYGAVATPLSRRTRRGDGTQGFAFLAGLNAVAALIGLYGRDLRGPARAFVVSTPLLLCALGFALNNEKVEWDHLLADLVWPLAALASTWRMVGAIEEQSAADARKMAADAASRFDEAFATGRRSVLALLRTAAEEIRAGLEDLADDDIAEEAARRLGEVDQRMAALK
jgi:hypothetical protein